MILLPLRCDLPPEQAEAQHREQGDGVGEQLRRAADAHEQVMINDFATAFNGASDFRSCIKYRKTFFCAVFDFRTEPLLHRISSSQLFSIRYVRTLL